MSDIIKGDDGRLFRISGRFKVPERGEWFLPAGGGGGGAAHAQKPVLHGGDQRFHGNCRVILEEIPTIVRIAWRVECNGQTAIHTDMPIREVERLLPKPGVERIVLQIVRERVQA